MTPLAAKLFMSGDDEARGALARSQFFECTALFPMIREMAQAETDITHFSEFAQLPAPETVIELHSGRGRMAYLCRQEGNDVHVTVYIPDRDGKPIERARTGFRLGTDAYLAMQWSVYAGEPPFPGGVITPADRRYQILQSFNTFVETTLRIINQPGLVEKKSRPTDKRIMRQFASAKSHCAPAWYECRIRPGRQGQSQSAIVDNDEPVMPLHYVRKYFKPSVSKWVEGYWRGDIALGLHLKWYSPQPPKGHAA